MKQHSRLFYINRLQYGPHAQLTGTLYRPHHVELRIVNEAVVIGREEWITLRNAIDPIFGMGGVETLTVVATDRRGDPIILEETHDDEPTNRRRNA